MTIRAERQTLAGNSAPRQLTCGHCGAPFECVLDGTCWCAHESVRLPMPVGGEECLCPECLREAARSQENVKPASDR